MKGKEQKKNWQTTSNTRTMSKKLAIGGDHAGFEYKTELIKILESEGYEVMDFGPYTDDSADYPDYVHPLCEAIEKG